jgi:hypothetical protein
MPSFVLRAAVAGAGVVAALTTGPLASAATGSPALSNAALAAASTAPCEAGGVTAADNALAHQLSPTLNGPRLGPSINGYQVSCARVIIETVQGRGFTNSRAQETW